jgi:hypothetical protein
MLGMTAGLLAGMNAGDMGHAHTLQQSGTAATATVLPYMAGHI